MGVGTGTATATGAGPVGGHLNLGGRVDPQSYHHQDSALANSILTLSQQANGNNGSNGNLGNLGNLSAFTHQYPQPAQPAQFSPFLDSEYAPQNGMSAKLHENVPFIDTTYASHPASKYGSPREDSRMPLSPVVHLSALDAPMPASFDSQGISYMARHGPVAASVPSKFGLESPPSSLPKKVTLPSDALRNLHDSAFGRESRAKGPNLASSPLGSGDEGFGQRLMHSQRLQKPRMLSASLPRARAHAADDWDDGLLFGQEEDFLPTSLHDLLTPQEKTRRLSKTEPEPSILRDSSSSLGTPAESSSKVGSPGTASPSRFGALFARQKREEENHNQAPTGSIFGHVGSPLRNSSLHPGASPRLRATSSHTISGDLSPRFASPSRQSSMSMISQQLSRTRLASRASEPSTAAIGSNNDATVALSLPHAARYPSSSGTSNLNRAVSSSSMGTGRINEEQADGVFPMEEEDDAPAKRYSGGSGWNLSSGFPPGSGSGGDPRSSGLGLGSGSGLRPSTNTEEQRAAAAVVTMQSMDAGAEISAGTGMMNPGPGMSMSMGMSMGMGRGMIGSTKSTAMATATGTGAMKKAREEFWT